MRGLVTQLDEPSWQANLGSEGSDRASVVGRLQRIDKRVDKPAASEEQPEMSTFCSSASPLRISETNRIIAIE